MKFFIQCCLLLSVWMTFSTTAQAQPTITVDTIIHATCNASDDGSIDISVAGTPPFTYQWSTGATTQDVTGLFSGSYVVTVTDGLSNSAVSNVLTVNAPSVLSVSTDSIVNNRCATDSIGEVYISVTGGVPGYTYLWDNGATTQDVTGLAGGAVNLTVTDANGCTSSSKSIFLDVIAPIVITVDSVQNISCNAANDGFINITTTGGVGNFTYAWSNGATTEDISGLMAGAYTVTATDSNNCVMTSGPHTITQPATLTFTLDSITHLTCNGDSTGAIFMTTGGGTGPYTYNWSNGATTEDITGLTGDTYFVTVTDTNNCQVTSGPHVVNEPPILIVSVDTVIHQLCANAPTGSVDISVSGGTPGYTYIWGNGATTQDVTGLYSGINDVTVTDANGCMASAKSIFLDTVAPIVIALDSIHDVTCNGANDGAVFITVTGGTGSTYTYNWSNGATTQDITGLGGNSYSVTVTDSNSCVMISGPHVVNEPAALVVTFDSLHHVDCNGNANGAVFVSVTGGTTPYTYNWSNNGTTQDITGLSGGSYSLTVTDANGCVDSTGPHVVNEPAVLTLTLDSIQHVDCNGNNNGGVFVTVAGGTTAYTYNWSNGATTQDITGLDGGNYTLTVTDANGCTVTDTAYVVNEPQVLTITLDSIQDVSCNGFNDGAVFVTVAGGTTVYTYNWSNGGTTEDITGLDGNSYTLTVTDANGCTATSGPHVVNEPAGMNITLDSIHHVSCNGAADGAVFITVTGGATPYGYLWSNNGTTQDITGLNGDDYTVTVTDANGCTVSSGPHTVNEDSAIVITLDTIAHVTCNGANDGSIGVTVTGGVPAYTYAWSNTATTQDITGLAGGNYTLTVTDANGCTATDTAYVVNEPQVLTVTLDSIQHVDCNGAANGAVFVTIAGGTTNYTFNWSNGGTTEDITGLNGGNYTLTVTDANGCTATSGPHVVNEPTALQLTLDTIHHVTCNGAGDGAVFVSVTGGTTPYTYAWSNAGTTQDITGLSGGNYTLTVTDGNGCTLTDTAYVVNEAPALVVVSDSIHHVTCNGAGDGAVFVTTMGGVPGYTFNWSNGGTTEDITGLNGGLYSLTVTDADGCTLTYGPDSVGEPAVLTATLDSVTNVSCNGGSDGAVYISIGGGTVPFSYDWSNGGTTQDITGLIAGVYTVTVTDSNGCTVTSGGHAVTEPTAITATTDSIHHVTCNGAGDGAVFTTVTGGTTPYTYAWSNGGTTEDITGLNGGNYTLTITDANGCTLTHGPDSVGEPAVLAVVIDSFKNESCAGISDGLVQTSASGGTAPFNFLWSNSATTSTITGLVAGQYTVTITDSNGCVAIDSITLTDNPTILVTLNSIDSVSCNGFSDGAINVTTTMGAPNYTWAWSNGGTTESITGLIAGNYDVTVTDSLGCQVTAGSYTVAEPNVLTISLDNITNVSCNGAADGAITMTTAGGTLNYTYNWSNSAAVTEDINGLSGGNYSVTVTDLHGCTATSGPHNVQEAPALSIALDAIQDVTCNGDADGFVQITPTGGVPGYTYNWSNAATTQDITGLSGNDYTVTLTDAAGCTLTSGPHTVNEPTALALTITPTVPLEGCLGQAIGVLDATASGGTGNLAYLWSNNVTTASNSGLNTGVYNLTVTDDNGCTITAVDSIQDPVRPSVTPFVGQSPITDTTINWGTTIDVDAGNDQTANGVTYAWTEVTNIGKVNFLNANDPATTVTPEPDSAGTYTLLITATSSDGCVDTGTVRITVTIDDLAGMPTAFTPNGDDANDFFRPAELDKQFILEFKIYNRWGQLIHDDTNTDANWDGKYNGVDQPRDVYIYLLRYQIPGQAVRVLRGEFTLLR